MRRMLLALSCMGSYCARVYASALHGEATKATNRMTPRSCKDTNFSAKVREIWKRYQVSLLLAFVDRSVHDSQGKGVGYSVKGTYCDRRTRAPPDQPWLYPDTGALGFVGSGSQCSHSVVKLEAIIAPNRRCMRTNAASCSPARNIAWCVGRGAWGVGQDKHVQSAHTLLSIVAMLVHCRARCTQAKKVVQR